MKRTAVLNIVGLSPDLLGPHTPHLKSFAERGYLATVQEALPAVTCTAQSTYLTGVPPSEHGIVGNGWYFRDESEIKFWRQSNKLVQHPKIWELLRPLDPEFTCANLFWWYNMYSSVDLSVTPRPMYPADGRKIPDIYTQPADLRDRLQAEFGRFPLFNFWGPTSSIVASRWIADAARWTEERHAPTLTLVYLPHLDYGLQRNGPVLDAVAGDLREIDEVGGDLIRFYEERGVQVIVLSEYGIEHASTPVHLNRALRERGLLAVREELGLELLDAGASAAFAVADHQVAHIYLNDPGRAEEVRELISSVSGVGELLDEEGKRARGLDHPRAGDLVAFAAPGAWFTYYYWLDDERAPDFARTVDIHRKPGYDPAELFFDRQARFVKLKAARSLLKKKLGFRYLMDVIGLDATLVKGSHGRPSFSPERGPLLITQHPELLEGERIAATDVLDLMLRHLHAGSPGDAASWAREVRDRSGSAPTVRGVEFLPQGTERKR